MAGRSCLLCSLCSVVLRKFTYSTSNLLALMLYYIITIIIIIIIIIFFLPPVLRSLEIHKLEPNKPHSFRPQPAIQNPPIPWNCLEKRWRCNVEVLQKFFEGGSWFRGGYPILTIAACQFPTKNLPHPRSLGPGSRLRWLWNRISASLPCILQFFGVRHLPRQRHWHRMSLASVTVPECLGWWHPRLWLYRTATEWACIHQHVYLCHRESSPLVPSVMEPVPWWAPCVWCHW